MELKEGSTMAVITLSREPYSGGSTLGEAIAKQLGYTLVTREDFSEIFREYGLITFEEFYSSPLNIWERLDEVQNDYMLFLRKVIEHIGSLDNTIILGRGSFAVFPDYRDVLNIRLRAPLETRIKRCMAKEEIDHKEARIRIEERDKVRNSFIAHCFHVSQANLQNAFDLVLNTGKMGGDTAIGIITAAVCSLETADSDSGNSVKDIKTDPILLDTIRKVLGEKRAASLGK